jgi:hypothetical protein
MKYAMLQGAVCATFGQILIIILNAPKIGQLRCNEVGEFEGGIKNCLTSYIVHRSRRRGMDQSIRV